jgi:hypothetical protein
MRAEPGQLALVESAMNEVRRAVSLPDSGWLGERPKELPRPAVEWGDPITTKGFEEAKGIVWSAFEQLSNARIGAVDELGVLIPKIDVPNLRWSEKAVLFLADLALQAVTGFLGAAIAQTLAAAGATAMSRGVNTAISDATKGGLRQMVREAMTSSFASEAHAAQAFCHVQRQALLKEKGRNVTSFLNHLEPIRALEERQPGAGVAELELMRQSIAEVTATLAYKAQFDASLAEWLKAMAQSSAGSMEPSDPGKGSNPEAISDFNEFHRGVLHLSATRSLDNPSAPLSFRGASIRGINKELIGRLNRIDRSIGELSLPVQVRTAQFSLGMNESKNVWLTVVSGLMGLTSWDTDPTCRYLYQLAHGDEAADEERLATGAMDGARKIMFEQVAPMKLSELNIQDSGLTR